MRTTDDPKKMVIRIRVNNETYEYLSQRANNSGMNVSEVVREIIAKEIKKRRGRGKNKKCLLEVPSEKF